MNNKKYIGLDKSKEVINQEIKRLILYGYVVVNSSETQIELEYAHGADRHQVLKHHYNYLKKDNNIYT